MEGDISEQAAHLVEKYFTKQEREAAKDLIRDAFGALPWELQELYTGVVELHRQRKWMESSKLWDEWMDRARGLGLI